ncbi:unnamed protein product [Sphagnum jensenii]|uniref:Uncharacterized protein n=1 Tax=Sphagnum jensenii TaxID=128206 RepID=A0ABP1A3L2_9BRYO
MQIRSIAGKDNAMASKLLIPILLGAICMITSITYLARARYSEYFKESEVISIPVATLDTAALVLECRHLRRGMRLTCFPRTIFHHPSSVED